MVANYWLISSSCLFLIPSFYAYHRQFYNVSGIGVATVLVSINYWRNPIPSMRKTMDITVANCCFVFVTYNGICYVPLFPSIMIGNPLLFITVWFFYLSNYYYGIGNPNWVLFHMLFHYCIAVGFGMMITYITE